MLAIYCRISQKKAEGKDRSIDYQKERGIAKAKELKLKYKVYIDEGISGTWAIEKRPAFFELLKDITDKKTNVTTVYAFDPSRLYRSDETRLTFLAAIRIRKIDLYFDKGIFDWSDPYMDFMSKVLSATDVLHVDITKVKVKGVLNERAKKGKVQGILPYGYYRDENEMMAVNPEEAEIVKLIYDLYLKGWGYRRIAEHLEDEQVLTRYNKFDGNVTYKHPDGREITKAKKDMTWNHSNIRNILHNKVYIGERSWGGIQQPCPAIIDTDVFNRIKYKIDIRQKKSGKRSDHRYILNDVCKCGRCGNRFTGRKSGKYRHYRCTSVLTRGNKCGNSYFDADALNTFIWQRFFLSYNLYDLVKEHLKNNGTSDKVDKLNLEVKKLEKSVSSLQKERQNAIQLTIKGILSENDVAGELQRIDTGIQDTSIKLKNLTEQLQSYANSTDNLKNIKSDFVSNKDKVSFNEQQELILKYIERITIDYENPFFKTTIKFTIPDMESEVYYIDRSYRLAFYIIHDQIIAWNFTGVENINIRRFRKLVKEIESITGYIFDE